MEKSLLEACLQLSSNMHLDQSWNMFSGLKLLDPIFKCSSAEVCEGQSIMA